MAEPYQDPETDRPNPIRRRTGSFPVRSNTNDTQYQLPAGSRHVPPPRRTQRLYADEPLDYSSAPPPAPPNFIQQRSFGSYIQSPQQGPGLQYAPYGYPADQPHFVQVPPPGRRQDHVGYGRYNDDGMRTSHGIWPAGPPMPYNLFTARHTRARSRSRSRSRSPRRPSRTETGTDYSSGTARRSRSREDGDDDDEDSEVHSSEGSSGSSYVDGEVVRHDDFIAAKAYQFRPSRVSRSPSQDASMTASGSEGEGPPPLEVGRSLLVQAEEPSSSTTRTSRTLKIYRSEYTGDAFADGSHSAKLTVIHDPKRTRQPVFRWMHIKQSGLNFDELSHEVSHISGLSDSDRTGLAKLMAEVKKNFVKSTPAANGSNVKHMEPKFLQILLPPSELSKGQSNAKRTATWLCIPYFSLERYAGPLSTANTATFPTQTLLQGQYSGVPPDRDMKQQVVRQLGHTPADLCFHINQLWCIILDNTLLITCGTESAEAAIQSDVLDIITEPLKDPSAGGTSGSSIYVYYTEAVLWALPLDECATWFAFISHFIDFWPQSLTFSHRDRPITADDWPRILNLAKYSYSKITLYLKTGNAPQPPPRGILKPGPKRNLKAEDKATEEPQPSLKPPQKGKGKADTTPAPESEGMPSKDEADDKFHVFSWLEAVPATAGDRNSQIQAESLQTQLQEVEDYLKSSTSFSDKRAYQDCQRATRISCFEYLTDQGDATEQFKRRPKVRRDYEDRIDILNAAEVVYRFFLPLEFDGPTVRKFWGAINLLIQMPQSGETLGRSSRVRSSRRTLDPIELVVPAIRLHLRSLTQAIQSFKNILSHAEPLERASIKVPDDLIRSWMHLVMALIYCTQGAQAWYEHIEIAETLVKAGMEEAINGMTCESLLKRVVIMPMEIVSLLSLKLLDDSTGGYPNIGATYSEYLDALANEIATKPSDRSFQHRISLLKQEIGVITKTVTAQTLIYSSLMRSPFKTQLPGNNDGQYQRAQERHSGGHYGSHDVGRASHERSSFPDKNPLDFPAMFKPIIKNKDPYMKNLANPFLRNFGHDGGRHDYAGSLDDWNFAPDEFYKLSPTEPAGFRDLLIAECLAYLENRAREFDGFDLHANDLQEENMNKFEDSKDRQELAIYAFTIVTVIFLPLSFVAGVFGMNTSDIRDMEMGQWAYWASAVPVTVLVIIIGLWWMGEIGNAFVWMGLRSGGGGMYALNPQYDRSSGGLSTFKSRPPPPPPPYQESYPRQPIVIEPTYGGRSSERVMVRERKRNYLPSRYRLTSDD